MSSTHGPRMNLTRTREVVTKLAIAVETATDRGIEIRRTVCPGGLLSFLKTERWHLTTEGLIGQSTWLRPIGRVYNIEGERLTPRGPYWNKGQLERALRAWKRGE